MKVESTVMGKHPIVPSGQSSPAEPSEGVSKYSDSVWICHHVFLKGSVGNSLPGRMKACFADILEFGWVWNHAFQDGWLRVILPCSHICNFLSNFLAMSEVDSLSDPPVVASELEMFDAL